MTTPDYTLTAAHQHGCALTTRGVVCTCTPCPGCADDVAHEVAMSPAFRNPRQAVPSPVRQTGWSRGFNYDQLSEIHDAVLDQEDDA